MLKDNREINKYSESFKLKVLQRLNQGRIPGQKYVKYITLDIIVFNRCFVNLL